MHHKLGWRFCSRERRKSPLCIRKTVSFELSRETPRVLCANTARLVCLTETSRHQINGTTDELAPALWLSGTSCGMAYVSRRGTFSRETQRGKRADQLTRAHHPIPAISRRFMLESDIKKGKKRRGAFFFLSLSLLMLLISQKSTLGGRVFHRRECKYGESLLLLPKRIA